MPDTKEFLSRLMEKNDDDLDSLLSFADGLKARSGHDNKSKEKISDSILDEILDNTPKKAKKKPLLKKLPDVPSFLPGSNNLHHITPDFTIPEYISYSSICDFESGLSAPVIEDESCEETSAPLTKEEETTEQEQEEAEEQPDETLILPDGKLPLIEEEQKSDAERFIANQENRHPVFYFAVGFSIVLVTVLGLASCIYLGVTAVRSSSAENISKHAATVVSAADIP
jgi:hypothetical protein